MQTPSEAPPPRVAPVRRVPLTAPFGWLSCGWRDLTRGGVASLLHGVLVALGGLLIVGVTLRFQYLLPGAVSGFLLVGPILATGLYALSRRLERGERATLRDAVAAWRRGTRPLVRLGLLLVVAASLWVLASAALFALAVKAPVAGVEDVLRHVVLAEDSTAFAVWMMLGGTGAALVFAATAVSVPLLLDRELDLADAVRVSVRAVAESPVAMALWAAIIMVATVLSMASLMLGFVITIPVIGHATWHAYRDVVDGDALPPRA